MTLVVDASALAELLLARPAALGVAKQFERYGDDLHAPHLLDVELLSTLRRTVAAGEVSAGRAEQALDLLADLRLERYPHQVLLGRAWALRDNFSAYDAIYLALAEWLSDDGLAALLTADGRFARAARTHSDVEILFVS